MERRQFVTLLGGGAATWPLAARAQQLAMPVIGYLDAKSPHTSESEIVSFRRGLHETGYVEGRNVAIEFRWAEDDIDRLPALAAELVSRRIAVIATASNLPAAIAAKAATQTIPVVFVTGVDPVKSGLVRSLARPGGNVTGFTLLAAELLAKRLELLRQLVPAATSVAFLANPTNAAFTPTFLEEQERAARALGLRLLVLNASTSSDIEAAFTTLVRQQVGGLLIPADNLYFSQRDQLVALAARHGIPTSYFRREFVVAGGLISYAARYDDTFRQAGVYVGRILKGEKPADLPVVQPTKFELVINPKAAKALGLEIPDKLLALADEVIE